MYYEKTFNRSFTQRRPRHAVPKIPCGGGGGTRSLCGPSATGRDAVSSGGGWLLDWVRGTAGSGAGASSVTDSDRAVRGASLIGGAGGGGGMPSDGNGTSQNRN